MDEPSYERLSDAILDVWSQSDGAAFQMAAREIKCNRYHVPLMQSNIDDLLALSKSMEENAEIAWAEVNRLRAGLKQIAEERVLAPIVAEKLLEESYKL